MKKRDDDLPSTSSAEYFTRSDHGKQEQQERKAAEKGQLSALKRDLLKQQIGQQLDTTDDQAPADIAAAHQQAQKETKQKLASFGPKSKDDERKQELQQAATPDQKIKDRKREEAAQKQAKEEYQQNMS